MSNPTGTSSSRVDFGRIAEDYEATRGIPDHFMKELIEDIIHICDLKPASLVLELGCGAGRFLRALASRKIPVVGVDISRGMLEKAWTNQQARKYLRSNLIACDAVAIPLNQGLFKGILAIHIFHLMTDWRVALAETLRVLRPDGILVTGYVGAVTHQSFLNKLYQQRRDELGYSTTTLGADTAEVVAELKMKGARVETHEYNTHVEVPLRVSLNYLERRVFSSMWRNLPDIIHRQIMQDVRTAATTQFKDLDDKEQLQIKAQLFFVTFGC